MSRWDDPDVDPVADMAQAIAQFQARGYDPKVFVCPVPLAKAWEQLYGRPLALEDVNALGPYWDSLVFDRPLQDLPRSSTTVKGLRPRLLLLDEAQDFTLQGPRPCVAMPSRWLAFCVEPVAHG